MKNDKLYICYIMAVIIICVMAVRASAQIVESPSSYLHKTKIGLVDEFMKRFNSVELHPDITPDDDIAKLNNMRMMFDIEYLMAKGDSAIGEVDNFINTAIYNNVRLNYNDSTWYAKAHCNGSLNKKPVEFTLTLKVQPRGEDMYKWVISDVEGDCFDVTPKKPSQHHIIQPDDHETKFISLSRMTNEQPFNVVEFMNDKFNYSLASVFAYLVYSNQLKINYVDKLEMIFTQVPGYIFKIDYFERDTSNSGWLISDLKYIGNSLIQAGDSHVVVHEDSSTILKGDITEKRVRELISMIDNYLFILTKVKDEETLNFYQIKLASLMIPEAVVKIEETGESLKVEDLCKRLLDVDNESIALKAITVPAIPSEMPDEKDIITLATKSKLVSLGDNTQTESSQILQLVKESTEDGDEWMPVFGNLIISLSISND